jgi:hypothetical protein
MAVSQSKKSKRMKWMNSEQIRLADDYAVWTDTTAKYPVTSEAPYLALGIADEAGELIDAHFTDEILKEGGDVLWYASRYCRRILNMSFSSIINNLDVYSASPSYPQIIRDIGTIAGVEKKRVRDGANWTVEVVSGKTGIAAAALIRILKWVEVELRKGGYTIYDAMAANQGKLNKRVAEGTIQGDGDNR